MKPGSQRATTDGLYAITAIASTTFSAPGLIIPFKITTPLTLKGCHSNVAIVFKISPGAKILEPEKHICLFDSIVLLFVLFCLAVDRRGAAVFFISCHHLSLLYYSYMTSVFSSLIGLLVGSRSITASFV